MPNDVGSHGLRFPRGEPAAVGERVDHGLVLVHGLQRFAVVGGADVLHAAGGQHPFNAFAHLGVLVLLVHKHFLTGQGGQVVQKLARELGRVGKHHGFLALARCGRGQVAGWGVFGVAAGHEQQGLGVQVLQAAR